MACKGNRERCRRRAGDCASASAVRRHAPKPSGLSCCSTRVCGDSPSFAGCAVGTAIVDDQNLEGRPPFSRDMRQPTMRSIRSAALWTGITTVTGSAGWSWVNVSSTGYQSAVRRNTSGRGGLPCGVLFEPRDRHELSARDDLLGGEDVLRRHHDKVRAGFGQQFVEFPPLDKGMERPPEMVGEQVRLHAELQDHVWGRGMRRIASANRRFSSSRACSVGSIASRHHDPTQCDCRQSDAYEGPLRDPDGTRVGCAMPSHASAAQPKAIAAKE